MSRRTSLIPSRAAEDLHGNAPDHSEVGLLLVDVINDFEFPGGDRLLRSALGAARALRELKRRARRAGVPCIYANDNFGRWRSDFAAQVRHCRRDEVRGSALAEFLAPEPDDYFVLKPKHSAFFQTTLQILLQHLGVESLVIGGFATDNCVNFSANDAFLHGYSLWIVQDGCAAIDPKWHRSALANMERVLHARLASADEIRFGSRRGKKEVRLGG